jgi:chorismate synthase
MAILEGLPSNLAVDLDQMSCELKRRQQGYGRGGRMKIESDSVQLVAGFLKGKTTGAPLGFLLENKDFRVNEMEDPVRPRPGHADLAGALKYNIGIRAILERASARETTMRVALGAVCRQLLKTLGIDLVSHVVRIGTVAVEESVRFEDIRKKTASSQLNCVSQSAEKKNDSSN